MGKNIENQVIDKYDITNNNDNNDAYSLFVYAIRSQITKDYYLRRLRLFFDYISLLPGHDIKKRCNMFAQKGVKDPNWTFSKIIQFLQFQKERVEKEEITGATLRNFLKAIKLFCEMSDIPITWKKITRGLPKIRRHANDRAPTTEEIQKICEYPDRRFKAIVYTMASSGIRLGAWDYLRWKDIIPVERGGQIVAAKIIVYAGDDEEYFSFITPEAYYELEKWIKYREQCGEIITLDSWVMRQLWNTREGSYHHGTIKQPVKLKSSGIKRLVEDALWTQGIRKKSDLKRNRYEFQTAHGLRKWFKTRCEISGMKSINIEVLMGHSIGISDSYYKITENEILDNYLNAVEYLTVGNENQLKKKIEDVILESQKNNIKIEEKIIQKEQELEALEGREKINEDVIASLSDQLLKITNELEKLKNQINSK